MCIFSSIFHISRNWPFSPLSQCQLSEQSHQFQYPITYSLSYAHQQILILLPRQEIIYFGQLIYQSAHLWGGNQVTSGYTRNNGRMSKFLIAPEVRIES